MTIATLPTVVTGYCDILWTDDLVNFHPVVYKSLFHSVQPDCSSVSRILLRSYRDWIFYCSKQQAAFLFLMQRSCDQLSDISHFVLATNQADTEDFCLLGHGVSPLCPYTCPLWSMFILCLSWLPCTTHWPVRAINFSSLCSSPFNGLDYFTLLANSVNCLGFISRPFLLYQYRVLHILAYSPTLRMG